MESSVFFKFKSQKEPTRVEFAGTGISVFELKREIIAKSGLGDGTDFDLAIYTEDGSEEYDDDTSIIPRSTTVIARRLPPIKPGAGRAARYVSGKAPVNAKRKDASKASAAKAASNAFSQMNAAQTEEEKMKAMFQAQTEQWTAQQEEMSHQTPVYVKSGKRPLNVPDHDPPNGYICYRCGEKGHWIQLCPTNENPEFDNRPRVKRTTGIPRSFLTTVDKSVALAKTGDEDESKRPSGLMVNADGDFVIAKPDKASWERYKAKVSSGAAAKAETVENKEVQERGLECPLDKKMFIEPMKTPCCGKTYCNDCITNALIESDFVCPGCETEGVLLDDLKSDDDASAKINEYLHEKARKPPQSPTVQLSTIAEEEEKGDSLTDDKKDAPAAEETATKAETPAKSPTPPPPTLPNSPPALDGSPAAPDAASHLTPTAKSTTLKPEEGNGKKRQADDLLENPKIPKAPKAMQLQEQKRQQAASNQQGMVNPMAGMNGFMGMPGMGMNMMPYGGMTGMGMGVMPNNMMMPVVNPMMGMPGMGMNGMNMNPGFPNMNGHNGMYPNYGDMSGVPMPGMGMGMGMVMGMGMNSGMNGGMNGGMSGPPMNGFQPNVFQPGVADEEAYFRKPVNPHRHQNRQKRVRPSDYREL